MNKQYAQELASALYSRPGSVRLADEELGSVVTVLSNTDVSGLETRLPDETFSGPYEGNKCSVVSLRRVVNNLFLADYTPSFTSRVAEAVHRFGNFSSTHVISAIANDKKMRDILLNSHKPYTLIARLDTTFEGRHGEKTSSTPLIVVPGISQKDMEYVQKFESRYSLGHDTGDIRDRKIKIYIVAPVGSRPMSAEQVITEILSKKD